ncbi:MAG: type II toxin-antitoxin system YafQ family toxin [Clostridia bacterium]|nr:type II toxin-antitoxin system YafQ family toxin [Clostridia bacterium]
MYSIEYTNKMKRDVRLMKKCGKDLDKLVKVLSLLAEGKGLPVKYKDHKLSGELSDFRECHIENDWLLIYQYHNDVLTLTATGTGTHADLFGI